MVNWAAWAPTIVTVITTIFLAGAMWNRQRDHSALLKIHSDLHEEAREHNSAQDIALARLEEWKAGFSAAQSTYERHK